LTHSHNRQKKAAKFANHKNYSVWETLAQHRKIVNICPLFKVYTGECYLSRDTNDRKISTRKQRTDNRKYSFVKRTIKFCNRLPVEALAIFPCRTLIFRKGVGTVIISEVK
jgi:hypothetical protein